MRIWRAIYNRAVKERIVEQDYPFCNVYTGIDTSEKTTEIYLASVDNTLVNDANRSILEKLNELYLFKKQNEDEQD